MSEQHSPRDKVIAAWRTAQPRLLILMGAWLIGTAGYTLPVALGVSPAPTWAVFATRVVWVTALGTLLIKFLIPVGWRIRSEYRDNLREIREERNR